MSNVDAESWKRIATVTVVGALWTVHPVSAEDALSRALQGAEDHAPSFSHTTGYIVTFEDGSPVIPPPRARYGEDTTGANFWAAVDLEREDPTGAWGGATARIHGSQHPFPDGPVNVKFSFGHFFLAVNAEPVAGDVQTLARVGVQIESWDAGGEFEGMVNGDDFTVSWGDAETVVRIEPGEDGVPPFFSLAFDADSSKSYAGLFFLDARAFHGGDRMAHAQADADALSIVWTPADTSIGAVTDSFAARLGGVGGHDAA